MSTKPKYQIVSIGQLAEIIGEAARMKMPPLMPEGLNVIITFSNQSQDFKVFYTKTPASKDIGFFVLDSYSAILTNQSGLETFLAQEQKVKLWIEQVPAHIVKVTLQPKNEKTPRKKSPGEHTLDHALDLISDMKSSPKFGEFSER
jgi:hypothetical protein